MASSELAKAQAALVLAQRQQASAEAQAPVIEEELSFWRDLIGQEDALAPRLRKAMRLRIMGGS